MIIDPHWPPPWVINITFFLNPSLSNFWLSNIWQSNIRLSNIWLSNIRLSNIRLSNIRLSSIKAKQHQAKQHQALQYQACLNKIFLVCQGFQPIKMKRHFDGKTVVAFDDGSLKEEMKARSSAILAFHLNLAIHPNAPTIKTDYSTK